MVGETVVGRLDARYAKLKFSTTETKQVAGKGGRVVETKGQRGEGGE